jgi:hypothetical protein
MQCAVYRDLLDAVMKEAPHRLDRISCRVLLAWPENDRVLAFERYGQPLLGALPENLEFAKRFTEEHHETFDRLAE